MQVIKKMGYASHFQTVDKGPGLSRGHGLFLCLKLLKFQRLRVFCGIILVS